MRIIIHAEILSANRKPDYGVAEETFTFSNQKNPYNLIQQQRTWEIEIEEKSIEAPYSCPKCGNPILEVGWDRMKLHRIARAMRLLALFLIPVRCIQLLYILFTGSASMASLPKGSGAGAFFIIFWPTIALYGLSLLFPTVRVDHCYHCKYHKETVMWKEAKKF